MEGRSHREIGRHLRIDAGHVAVLAYRARKALAVAYLDQIAEPSFAEVGQRSAS